MSSYRVAIAGAGGMGSTHARGYTNLPNADLVAVMDIRPEAAEALASAHGAKAFTDLVTMLAEIKPDIVDICVPTPWHRESVELAAATKPKGIVVEKPMARTVADAEAIKAVCEANGVPLFVAHVLRFFPEFVAARKQVNAGAVGEVTSVRTRRGGQFPRAWQDWYGKVDWSGGAILDLVIHDLDWLRWTFGEVERVFAKGTAAALGEGAVVDLDYSLITLRFTSGAMAHVEATWADPGGFKVSFEICGDEGMLEYNFNEPAAPPLIVAKQASSGAGAGVPVPESPLAVSPYQLELAHFLHCLDTGATPTVTPQDGIEAVRIANAAIESCRTGKVITLNSGTEAKS